MPATDSRHDLPMQRRHDIDTLRVLAFALLILYHTAMAYVAGWDFHLKSVHAAGWLQWPMVALNRWRMPLLFLIGGMALSLSGAGRAPWRAIRRRSRQLLLPLLFGIVVIIPIQPYAQAVDNGSIAPGFWAFLLRFWQFRPFPAGAFPGAEYGFTWNHLWFLPYLWSYSVLVLAGLAVARHLPRPRWPALPAPLRGACLVLLPVAWLAAVRLFLHPRFPESHAWAGDWAVHAESLFVFLLGFAIACRPAFWAAVTRRRWPLLGAATCLLAALLSLRAGLLPLPAGRVEDTGQALCRAGYAWLALLAILGWGKAWLDRPFPWLPYARTAVFPWYLLHQSLTIGLLFALRPLALGPLWEPLLVLGGTVAGCFLIHDLVVLRCRLLQPLFGVSRAVPPLLGRRRGPVQAPAAPAGRGGAQAGCRCSTSSWIAPPPRKSSSARR